jgi:5-methyltetrahydrofolate--homocysteine methyltransferase
MNKLIERLMSQRPIVTDGAWGTQLQARGLPVGAVPDEWNLSRPDKVAEVPAAYAAAGAKVVLTNTFGANRIILARSGMAEKAAEINRAGAQISKKAVAGRAYVFASIGPCGKMVSMGEVSEEDAAAAFREQAAALAEGGADALVIETMSDLQETVLALKAAKESGLPVVACMSYDSGPKKDRTMMGVAPEQAAEELAAAGADVVGANCGQGIDGYIDIARRLRAATKLPIWIKANAGLPEMKDGKVFYRTTAAEFASHGPSVVAAGADFIGGCCGTGPDFIKALAKALRPK